MTRKTTYVSLQMYMTTDPTDSESHKILEGVKIKNIINWDNVNLLNGLVGV
jgi:hypothetical protein